MPCRFELVSVQPQPYQPCAEGELCVGGHRLFVGCTRLCQGLVVDCEAELDVGFYLARVEGAVEESVMYSST
jgi:hypothetical protein